MSGGGEVKKKGRGIRGWWGKKKKEKRKNKEKRSGTWVVGKKKKKKKGRRNTTATERECGRKIGKEGILGVVKYKRK
jgi:hypothetical protein